MRTLTRLFADHPRTVGETYFQHMSAAFGFGSKMLLSGLACMAHGVFPFLYQATGSKTVSQLHTKMITRRAREEPTDDVCK